MLLQFYVTFLCFSFRVFSSGSSFGTGPSSFTAWTKSGEVLYFGLNTNSRIYNRGQFTRAISLWALSKKRDKFGNYITYTYNRYADNDAFYVSKIAYTGNVKMGLSPSNAITFRYIRRSSLTYRLYSSGSNLKQDYLLSSIVTSAEGKNVLTYRILYTEGKLTKEPLVSSILECPANSGANTKLCSTPTKFFWNTAKSAVTSASIDFSPKRVVASQRFGSTCISSNPTTSLDASRILLADFNGDGMTDIYIVKPSSDLIHLSQFRSDRTGSMSYLTNSYWTSGVSGPNTYENSNQKSRDIGRVKILDVDGDAVPDVLYLSSGKSSVYLTKSSSSQRVSFTSLSAPGVETDKGFDVGLSKYQTGDFNGDGLTDILTIKGDCSSSSKRLTFLVHLNRQSSFASPSTFLSTGCSGLTTDTFSRIFIADFTGDGKADLFLVLDTLSKVKLQVYESSGRQFVSLGSSVFSTGAPDSSAGRIKILDVNGDGMLDVMIVTGFDRTDSPAQSWTSSSSFFLGQGKGKFLKKSGIRFPRFKSQAQTEVSALVP